jgi:hypothetical protein
MYVLLLNIGEFRENRRGDGRTFLSGVTAIALTRVPLNRMTFGK